MALNVKSPIVFESLQIELVHPRAVRLSGALNTPTAQVEVSRFLEGLHKHIVEERITSFSVDVRPLSFVNSSALRVFISWISRAEIEGYKLVFMTDARTTWHRLSFSVLRSLAPKAVEIVEHNGSASQGGAS